MVTHRVLSLWWSAERSSLPPLGSHGRWLQDGEKTPLISTRRTHADTHAHMSRYVRTRTHKPVCMHTHTCAGMYAHASQCVRTRTHEPVSHTTTYTHPTTNLPHSQTIINLTFHLHRSFDIVSILLTTFYR